jgi:hypothetical protein
MPRRRGRSEISDFFPQVWRKATRLTNLIFALLDRRRAQA